MGSRNAAGKAVANSVHQYMGDRGADGSACGVNKDNQQSSALSSHRRCRSQSPRGGLIQQDESCCDPEGIKNHGVSDFGPASGVQAAGGNVNNSMICHDSKKIIFVQNEGGNSKRPEHFAKHLKASHQQHTERNQPVQKVQQLSGRHNVSSNKMSNRSNVMSLVGQRNNFMNITAVNGLVDSKNSTIGSQQFMN